MLKDMEVIFAGFGVDFYIVGATARDYHLSAAEEAAALRKTDDVDLGILLNDAGQFNSIKAKLIESGKFTAHPTEHIKLFYEGRIEVDLLPFGKIEAGNGMVFLQPPNSFSLSMPGFKEVYPFVEKITSEDGLSIKVCPVEGIIILKLISYRDRPERTKDISDIEHIFDVFFNLSDENIYDEHFDLMDKYDVEEPNYFQLISARVIGRKMRKILKSSDKLDAMIKSMLVKRYEYWVEPLLGGLSD